MVDLEEVLKNIDVFCKVLVDKMLEKENDVKDGVAVEPMENLLRRKHIVEESLKSNPMAKCMISLPQFEEPLIDVFEDDNYVKILVQCHCQEQKISFHMDVDGVEICRKECYNDADGEVCVDKCQKLNLPVKHLQIENITAKCNKNEVLEVNIPKQKAN
ncbi:MAG: hypothetical protein QW270_02205 [Candidatus Bathyarchaeia archaeon]